MSLLKQLFSSNAHWQLSKDFVKAFGIDAAILMADLVDKWVYFEFSEWFYNTIENIEEDTTLSKFKQANALEVLKENGFIEIKLIGTPPKRHFKLIENNLVNFFSSNFPIIRKLNGEKLDVNFPIIRKLNGEKLETNNNKYNNNKEIIDIVKDDKKLLYNKIEKSKKNIINFIKDNKPSKIEPYKDLWNIFAIEYGLNQIKTISDARVRKFRVRIKEPDFDFIEILSKVKNSEFLRTGKWFGWDWIFENEKNYIKILEGNYDNPIEQKAEEKTERFKF